MFLKSNTYPPNKVSQIAISRPGFRGFLLLLSYLFDALNQLVRYDRGWYSKLIMSDLNKVEGKRRASRVEMIDIVLLFMLIFMVIFVGILVTIKAWFLFQK